MKILLINPWLPEVFPTPAVGYLASALRYYGYKVKLMDLLEALNTNEYFDVVAVSFHSFSVKYARVIRAKFNCKLICGGHHPSALPEQMLKIGYDHVVIGEGENALLSILNGNKDSIVYADKTNYFGDTIEYPFPYYDGLKFTGEMGIPIISSRGCPYQCNFCASSKFWKGYRARKADNVIKEIEYWISKGITKWMFEDDNFTINKRRAIEIAQGIKQLGNYTWQCASRAETIDDELAYNLASAGCKTIWLGIESFSQPSLDRCNKHTSVELMLKGIATIRKFNMDARCQFIIGLPGDTDNDINETVRVMKQNNIHAGGNILWLLPNTQAYFKAKNKGFDDETYLINGAPYYTYEQDINKLNYWYQLITKA